MTSPSSARLAVLTACAALALQALRSASTHPETAAAGDAVLVLACLASVLRLGPPGWRAPLFGLGAFVLLASHVAAEDAWRSQGALAHVARLALAAVVGAAIARIPACARRAVEVLAVIGVIASLHALLQVTVLHPRLLAEHGSSLARGVAGQLADGRGNSVFVLPGHLGAFLGACMPAALCVALDGRRTGRVRMAGAIAALIAAAGVAIAGSITGVLCALAGVVTFALLATHGRARWMVLAATLLGAALIIGGSIARRADEVRRESPASARLLNWTAAARMAREAPVFGHGGGSFGIVAPRFQEAGSNDARHAHQGVLQAAAEHGLLAAVLLLALVGSLARRAIAAARRGTSEELALAGGVAALLVSGLADFTWLDPGWATPAAALVGMFAGLSPRESNPASSRELVASVVVALLGGLLLSDSIPRSRAASRIMAATELGLEGDHAAAARGFERARAIVPRDSEAAAALATALVVGAPAGEDGAAARAAGVAHAREAVRLSPSNAGVREVLALALRSTGQLFEAEVQSLRARELAPLRQGSQ